MGQCGKQIWWVNNPQYAIYQSIFMCCGLGHTFQWSMSQFVDTVIYSFVDSLSVKTGVNLFKTLHKNKCCWTQKNYKFCEFANNWAIHAKHMHIYTNYIHIIQHFKIVITLQVLTYVTSVFSHIVILRCVHECGSSPDDDGLYF